MAITYERYMEERYTLQVLINSQDADTGIIDVPITEEHEDLWRERLGFEYGVALDRYFAHPTLPDFSGMNVFDVLALIRTISEDPQGGPAFAPFVAFYRVRYIPTNAPGNRVIVQFYVSNAVGDDSALATIGLSHSINR